MTTRRNWIAVVAVSVALGGLSCGTSTASINDLTVRGFQLLEVDGQPVVRAQSKYVTVIPFALVRPGLHSFRVRMETNESGAPEETLFVSARVVAGKRYRFEAHGETLQLVEEKVKE